MFRTVTLLTLISRFEYAISNIHACVPNTQFFLNNLICSCDSKGQWTEASCLRVSRRQNCQPGKVIWQGCSQCICQENGQLLCNINVSCPDDSSAISTTKREGLHSLGYKCTPFRIYYVDCNICICPASGLTSNAHCAKDTTCTSLKTPTTADLLASVNKNLCLPKVMYLFACLHCLCSDDGYFVLENCVETCQPKKTEPRSCSPKSFYRKDCNVCYCPENKIPDDKYCSQEICNGTIPLKVLHGLRTTATKCTPYQFTSPRCLYCDCSPEGIINEHACLELNCLKFNSVVHKVPKETCNPGEMVSICLECFCLRDSSTRPEYCSRVCSNRSKIEILEKVFKESRNNHLLDTHAIEKNTVMKSCIPNSIYVDNGKFCLCPDNGVTNQNSCIVEVKKGFNFENPASEFAFQENKISIDFNATCEPSSFVEFECNTCFCSKNGTIDPRWCTYDDCEAKKIVQDAQNANVIKEVQLNKCIPGSITKLDCNFCICPENGVTKNRACTKNRCSETEGASVIENFTCEPLAYYEVDCNVCFCPRDGKKNVAKCTKNLCEKNFLRTEVCVPGRLFSDECNVCVCPPNGNKEDKVCTSYKCQESALVWKNIFKFSNGVLNNQISDTTARKLDLCFPGEEFTMGCHLCVCPEMGIRSYATCTDMICDETNSEISIEITKNTTTVIQASENPAEESLNNRSRKKNFAPVPDSDSDGCWIFNISDSAERHDCTPGTMYIIRCRQCICPYMGNINDYCRPMRKGEYCEQAYPGINYLPMGRRQSVNSTTVKPSHNHTRYDCDKPGKVMDKCFICECEEDNKIIREHCFKNQAQECEGKEPSFLKEIKMLVL